MSEFVKISHWKSSISDQTVHSIDIKPIVIVISSEWTIFLPQQRQCERKAGWYIHGSQAGSFSGSFCRKCHSRWPYATFLPIFDTFSCSDFQVRSKTNAWLLFFINEVKFLVLFWMIKIQIFTIVHTNCCHCLKSLCRSM